MHSLCCYCVILFCSRKSNAHRFISAPVRLQKSSSPQLCVASERRIFRLPETMFGDILRRGTPLPQKSRNANFRLTEIMLSGEKLRLPTRLRT